MEPFLHQLYWDSTAWRMVGKNDTVHDAAFARVEGKTPLAVRAGRMRHREELEQAGGTVLQSQDSLAITHARLAKQKRDESALLLDQIKDMEARVADLLWISV